MTDREIIEAYRRAVEDEEEARYDALKVSAAPWRDDYAETIAAHSAAKARRSAAWQAVLDADLYDYCD